MEKKAELQQLEKEIRHHQLVFLYMGSYALRVWYGKRLVGFQPPDIDVLIHGSTRSLLSLLASLVQHNWDVKVWGESFSARWTVAFLRGKWYARIKKGKVICDLSFEYPYLDVSQAFQNSVTHAEHRMCCMEDLWYLKLLKNPGIAQSFAQAYQLAIPEQSVVRWKRWVQEERW